MGPRYNQIRSYKEKPAGLEPAHRHASQRFCFPYWSSRVSQLCQLFPFALCFTRAVHAPPRKALQAPSQT